MLYRYVGSRSVAERCGYTVRGSPVCAPEDFLPWLESSEVTVTFVVNEQGALLIADRHSEHVACAGNRPVRAAGEMTFVRDGGRIAITRISNQSTGYCPEPESWDSVVDALQAVGLEPTGGFDPRCEFRRCLKCRSLNLVKDRVFECAVCETALPTEYNAQMPTDSKHVAFQYRVTKYDPRLRDGRGAFLRDDWTSIGDVGKPFDGIILTPEAYQAVEDAYVEAALALLTEAGFASAQCVDVENHGMCPTAKDEGESVPLSELGAVIRDVLRGEWWCRVEATGAFLHFGNDCYMYVGVPIRCERACDLAHRRGLFVEPFVSPYHREE